MIRGPFLTNPAAWVNSSRKAHDRLKYASAIEIGRRPLWWFIWRLFR